MSDLKRAQTSTNHNPALYPNCLWYPRVLEFMFHGAITWVLHHSQSRWPDFLALSIIFFTSARPHKRVPIASPRPESMKDVKWLLRESISLNWKLDLLSISFSNFFWTIASCNCNVNDVPSAFLQDFQPNLIPLSIPITSTQGHICKCLQLTGPKQRALQCYHMFSQYSRSWLCLWTKVRSQWITMLSNTQNGENKTC